MTTPRPEYPRPHFDRSHAWLSLNGAWDFSFGEPTLDRTITVPFAWETPASGIEAHWQQTGWYRRTITVPAEWAGERVVLHVGAAHHETVIWVNDTEVVRHRGGYTPFEADITDALTGAGEQEVRIRVDAPADKREIAHGKQRSVPRTDYDGVCFTPSSGIWQSVWLEARPATHLTSLQLRPSEDLKGIDVRVRAAGAHAAGATVMVGQLQVTLDDDGEGSTRLDIAAPRLWSPADPHLYHVEVILETPHGEDRVTGYTGLRRVRTDGEDILLNGERLWVKGVLDQGYWPRTGITAPTDDALARDLELARDLGYTLVRKHLKLEDPRFAYHADRMGMLLWCEPASTGTFTAASTVAFEDQIAPMVDRDGNSPAIVIWGLYNEEWGLDWDVPGDPAKQDAVVAAYERLAALDHTRPIVDNSGWTHVRTDLLDWHYYDESAPGWARTLAELERGARDDFPVKLGPDFVVQKALAVPGQPLRGLPNLNSEYGTGFTSVERGWHLRWQTQELRRYDRLSGYVYTELYDIEHESAGLLTFDREPKDLGGAVPAAVNAPTTLVLDLLPVAPGRDVLGGTAEVAVHVSHHGTELFTGRVRTAWGTVYSTEPVTEPVDGPAVEAKPFTLSDPATVTATLPDGWASGRLHLTAVTADGTVAARAAIDVDRSTAPHIGDDPTV
ncbi:glycoside hydrolase family 2 protein [Catenuloplanes japonicus]|uniref:glycoside hydrolase family 2 protein n=1 Tax=Catenuloplanes japonicus TaxID=33876 RepID=UPI000524DF33|nr:glycoside hydrolase family 2 [Catenuloplanes japonicus]